MSKLSAIVVFAAVLVGVTGAVVALQGRGGEQALRDRQAAGLGSASARALSPARVQAFVVRAPEPVPAAQRTKALLATCAPGGPGPLRNPWSCQIHYRSGTRAHYRVVVQPNGRYRGVGSGIIEGCCIAVPTLD